VRGVVATVLFLLAFAGCGATGVDANRQTVTYTAKSLSLLADTFVAGDRVYQESIRKDKPKLTNYRTVVRPKVLLAFAEARAAVAAWRAAGELYAIGKAKQSDVDAAGAEVGRLLAAVQQAVASALGGK